jgi:hypothetical protein
MYISLIVRSIIISIAILLATGAALGQCPTITVIGPAGITYPGETMTFAVTVTNDAVTQNLKYSWSVSVGVITSGQGSRAITVVTDRSMEGANVTATATIDGLSPNCTREMSETAPVAMIPIGEPIDDWPDSLASDDKRARLDAFFMELSNNPDNVGIMVIRVIGRDRKDDKNRRVRFVLEHARFRKFDKSRLWFAFENGYQRNAVFWRMVPTVEVPCDWCKIVKGGDIK